MLEIWRQMMKLDDPREGQEIIVRVNPDIYSSLQADEDHIFQEVEEALNIHLVFKPDAGLHHEQFDVMAI